LISFSVRDDEGRKRRKYRNYSNHGEWNEMKTSAIEAIEPRLPHNAGFAELFLLFSKIGFSSFGGGVSVWMHTALVERRGWLDEKEFSSALALARLVPGVNIVNLAVLIGHRLIGFRGAVAAVAGLLVGPSLIAIAIAILYRRFAGTMIIDAALAGTAAAAAGLLIGMGVKSCGQIVRRSLTSTRQTARGAGAIVVLVATFALVGLLRFPTAPTVLGLMPFSLALAWFGSRKTSMGRNYDGG
jgi:chromate transporter